MRAFTFFYWTFLSFMIGLVAYASLSRSVPVVFLAGGIVTAFVYLAVLVLRFRRTGTWEHARFRFWFHAALLAYIAVFWAIIGLTEPDRDASVPTADNGISRLTPLLGPPAAAVST